jgi:hypothetical protein
MEKSLNEDLSWLKEINSIQRVVQAIILMINPFDLYSNLPEKRNNIDFWSEIVQKSLNRTKLNQSSEMELFILDPNIQIDCEKIHGKSNSVFLFFQSEKVFQDLRWEKLANLFIIELNLSLDYCKLKNLGQITKIWFEGHHVL